jgi:hypothetical protein
MKVNLTNNHQGRRGLLKDIILQVCQQFITEVADFFKAGKAVNLAEMENSLKKAAKNLYGILSKPTWKKQTGKLQKIKPAVSKKGS